MNFFGKPHGFETSFSACRIGAAGNRADIVPVPEKMSGVGLFPQSMASGEENKNGVAAAKAAQCHEFIERLPQGYETRIGDEGVYLSGGEAQRVCVARAILKNAPILVLDEATAFADPENEYKMQQALQSLIKGKTVIIIAHRLSSIVSADNIVVLQQGRIVQQGQHDDLSVAEGLYKNMWDAYTSAYHWKLNKN